MSTSTKPPPAVSRLPSGFGKLAGDLLDGLIADFGHQDVAAVRAARLAEVPEADRAAWGTVYEALDRVLVALHHRERAIRRGEVVRELPEAPPIDALPTPPPEPEAPPAPEAPTEAAPTPEPAALGAENDDAITDVARPPEVPPEPSPAPEPPTAVEPPAAPDAPPAEAQSPASPPPHDTPPEAPTVPVAPPVTPRLPPRKADTPPPPAVASPADDVDFHERRTVVVPSIADAEIEAARAARLAPPQIPARATAPVVPIANEPPRGAGWSRRAELLFDDALRLFRMGDVDGGLVSLERLLVSTEVVDDLKAFVDVNQDRVLERYESVMAPWNRIPERMDPSAAPHLAPFLDLPKVAYVLARITGRDNARTLALQCEAVGLRRLEVAAVLSQLVRAGVIRLRDT